MPSNSAVRRAKAQAKRRALLTELFDGTTSPTDIDIVWSKIPRRVTISEALQTRANPGDLGDLGIDLNALAPRGPAEPLPIEAMARRPHPLPSLRGYTNRYYWCEWHQPSHSWTVIEYSRYGFIACGRYATPEECHARQQALEGTTRYRGKGCTLAEANLIIESLPARLGATWPPEK